MRSPSTGYGQLVRNASQGAPVEERQAARDGHADRDPGSSHAAAPEPDARFTLANERTFLAWNRTALALVVAGLGIVQLLPPFPGVPWGRHALGVPLIVLGAAVSVTSYWNGGGTRRPCAAALRCPGRCCRASWRAPSPGSPPCRRRCCWARRLGRGLPWRHLRTRRISTPAWGRSGPPGPGAGPLSPSPRAAGRWP